MEQEQQAVNYSKHCSHFRYKVLELLQSGGMSFNIPHGESFLELSPSSTVPGSPEFAHSQEVVEVLSSQAEVEEAPTVLTSEQELQKMKEEERHGFLYRVQDRQKLSEDRVRGVVEAMALESPQVKKARRVSIRTAIVGEV